jgi:hypothetical protein
MTVPINLRGTEVSDGRRSEREIIGLGGSLKKRAFSMLPFLKSSISNQNLSLINFRKTNDKPLPDPPTGQFSPEIALCDRLLNPLRRERSRLFARSHSGFPSLLSLISNCLSSPSQFSGEGRKNDKFSEVREIVYNYPDNL